MTSDGVVVLTKEPICNTQSIIVSKLENNSSILSFNATWDRFHQPELQNISIGGQELSTSAMDYYEWTIMVDYEGTRPRKHIIPWLNVPPQAEHDGKVHIQKFNANSRLINT